MVSSTPTSDARVAPGASRPPRGRRRRRPSPGLVLGLVLLLAGLSVLGWAAWQYWGTNITSSHAAGRASTDLRQRWDQEAATRTTAPDVPTSMGAGMALVRIPDLGADWQYPVIAGTSEDVLARGIGWYATSAKPGQVGNFALAGHRVTHGEPFRRLLELEKGARVVVETRDAVYTYELDNAPSQLTVAEDASWVLDPVPGKPSARPTRALITLTTCQDLFHSPDRSVAFGHLVDTQLKK